MKFNTRQDIEAPLAQVWATITDFDAWERAAMRRGADVARTDSLRSVAAGMNWTAKFRYRGKDRALTIALTRLEVPHKLGFKAGSQAVEADIQIELMEMAARRTRMHLSTELHPHTLGARLFLQSLRLARARVERKFQTRIASLAREIETRARQREA